LPVEEISANGEQCLNWLSQPRGQVQYIKTRDARAILRDKDLSVAIRECSELKALVNTILDVCNSPLIP
jgi:hypothetical protein